MKAELVPENGDPPIPITKDLTVVGRKEQCDVRIDDPSLSKRHCVLVKTDGLLVVRDLATTNGTKVKGQRVRWAALLPEDRLTLGAYKVRVYLGPDDVPSPSEGRTAAKEGVRPAPPVKSAPPPKAVAARGASTPPAPDFAPPSPLERPDLAADDSGLVLLDEDSDGSVWRNLINTGKPHDEPNDLLIELD